MASKGIRWDMGTLKTNLTGLDDKVDRALAAVVEFHAPRAQAYARQNAPWNDQTSNARNGLRAEAQHKRFLHSIVIFHSVPYGIWLEVRWEGKYAIIMPTVQHEGKEVMKTASKLLATLR